MASWKTAYSDLLDDVRDISKLQRESNNMYKGRIYRIDTRSMNDNGNGHQARDFKVDVQTVGQGSTTVGLAFLAPMAPDSSLPEVIESLEESLRHGRVYRVW